MFGGFRLIMLAMLVQVLIHTSCPTFCAGLYAMIAALITWIHVQVFGVVLISLAVSFTLSWVYFRLLDALDESMFFWPVMLVGIFLLAATPL